MYRNFACKQIFHKATLHKTCKRHNYSFARQHLLKQGSFFFLNIQMDISGSLATVQRHRFLSLPVLMWVHFPSLNWQSLLSLQAFPFLCWTQSCSDTASFAKQALDSTFFDSPKAHPCSLLHCSFARHLHVQPVYRASALLHTTDFFQIWSIICEFTFLHYCIKSNQS